MKFYISQTGGAEISSVGRQVGWLYELYRWEFNSMPLLILC